MTEQKLRRFVKGQELARYVGRRWVIDDQRAKIVQTASRGSIQKLTVKGFDQASLAGQYWDAIGRFVDTNSRELLTPFRGLGLTDTQGVFHPFELNPNTLHRLQAVDNQAFHEVYRAVA